MKWPWQKEAKGFESVLERLVAAQEGSLSGMVTPDNCMQSPTVQAIVTAVARRLAVTPVHVYRTSQSQGQTAKQRLPNHPAATLLRRPNQVQTGASYWLDSTSALLRWGNFYAIKLRGQTGPIRRLVPIHPGAVEVLLDDDFTISYRITMTGGEQRDYPASEVHHVRMASRSFVRGDSPIKDVSTAIALEILAEQFGATFFKNGALPLMIFKIMQGSQGFRNKEEESAFVESFQDALGGGKRFRAMLLPKGIEEGEAPALDNERAQFLETRKYQRTVIAGAFGVPPHLVGDLERATFNNVEQQDKDFVLNTVLPIARVFEQAMERDLLTDADRAQGVVIRFNLNSILRADFASRQAGLNIQRQAGVINPNEWREVEDMNPISAEDGGNEYWRQGPSGQTGVDNQPEEDDAAGEAADSARDQGS